MPSTLIREDIKRKFNEVRALTESICKPLNAEDYVPQPVDYVSPAKWHLAHTTWFFEEFVLSVFVNDYEVFNPEFSFLFNSYYQHVGDRVFRANRGSLTRPSVQDIYSYRDYVNEHMSAFLENDLSEIQEATLDLGLNHEQQHQELLLTDLKFILGQNPIFPIYKKHGAISQNRNQNRQMIAIPEGIYDIGYTGSNFCFDNELSPHKVYLHEFEIDSGLVTNKEYFEFIEDGGYKNFKWWLDEGWSWVRNNEIKTPLYWLKLENKWHHFTLGGLQTIDPEDILCHISFYEANAFAAWKGMRLPTEFEWEVASDHIHWGTRWEWTNSAFLPYPGFKIAEGAIGEYNGKFMINQMVLRGASVATSPGHSRKSYRNFFHPHYQWQFTGIRLAK